MSKIEEAIDLLKGVRTLWLELSEAEYDCNGGQDFDKALALLEAEEKTHAERIKRLEKALAIAREYITYSSSDELAVQRDIDKALG